MSEPPSPVEGYQLEKEIQQRLSALGLEPGLITPKPKKLACVSTYMPKPHKISELSLS